MFETSLIYITMTEPCSCDPKIYSTKNVLFFAQFTFRVTFLIFGPVVKCSSIVYNVAGG